jgi:hypothetical protein
LGHEKETKSVQSSRDLGGGNFGFRKENDVWRVRNIAGLASPLLFHDRIFIVAGEALQSLLSSR